MTDLLKQNVINAGKCGLKETNAAFPASLHAINAGLNVYPQMWMLKTFSGLYGANLSWEAWVEWLISTTLQSTRPCGSIG